MILRRRIVGLWERTMLGMAAAVAAAAKAVTSMGQVTVEMGAQAGLA